MRLSALLRTAKFRLLHRDLYDDTAQQRRLRELSPTLNGKTVAVVGNAQSLFEQDHGAAIDAHDVVIRFNNGYVTDPSKQGARTDILCLANETPLAELRQRYGNPAIIWVTPMRELMADDLAACRGDLLVVPLTQWERLHREMHGARPSAGAIAIHLLRTVFDPRQISLFGFDWKATRTFYHDRVQPSWHDWSGESRLIQSWAAADNRIALHIA